MGDGDGDFYFKVTSATNPNHTFTYKMTAVGLTPANVSASAGQYQNARQYVVATDTDSGKVMYSSVNKNTNTAQAGSAVSNLAPNMFPFDYFNNSESTVTSKNATAPSISLQIYQQTNGNWAVKTHFSRKRGGEWYSFKADIAIFNGSNMPKWDFSDGYTIEFGSDYATGSDICFTSVNGWNFSKDITKDGQVDMDISYNGTINEDGNIYLRKGQSLDTFTETKTVLYTSAWKKSFETNVYMPESLSDVSSWEVGTYSPTLQLERFAEEYPSFQKQFSIVVEQPYTISLNENGGVPMDDILYSTHTLQYCKLSNPVRWGWEFVGWFKDAAFTEQVTELSTGLGNCTLYAKWKDETPPVVENNGKPYLETLSISSPISLSASDVYAADSACGVIPDSQISIFVKKVDETDYAVYNDSFSFNVGKYYVKYVAIDSNGNQAEYVRMLNIVSAKSQLISLDGEIEPDGIVGKRIDLPTAAAGDCEVVRTIIVNGEVMELEGNSLIPSVAGEYNIVYYAESEDGLNSQLFYTIMVVDDTESPVFSLSKTDYKVLRNTVIKLETLLAMDNVDGEVECSIKVMYGAQEVPVVDNQFTVTDFGSYTVTYFATDLSGNTNNKSYNIQVVEKIVDTDNDSDGSVGNDSVESNLAQGCNGSVVGIASLPLTLISLYLLKKKRK